jgi:WD40 repeat protein
VRRDLGSQPAARPKIHQMLVRDSKGRLQVWDEGSSRLHRRLKGFRGSSVTALASFLSPDGQQPRLVAGSNGGDLVIYGPEAGSVLHDLKGHNGYITGLACIASSSAAPHHPRLVSAAWDGTVKVWDGETGGLLSNLPGPEGWVMAVAVWKEHTGGHDRIATTEHRRLRVWDGEALTLLHDLDCGPGILRVSIFESAEGPTRLLRVLSDDRGLQVWDPEEGRLLHDGINRECPLHGFHLFESAQGRHLLAILSRGDHHPLHPGGTVRAFLDVWDLGEAPAREAHVRGAHKHG